MNIQWLSAITMIIWDNTDERFDHFKHVLVVEALVLTQLDDQFGVAFALFSKEIELLLFIAFGKNEVIGYLSVEWGVLSGLTRGGSSVWWTWLRPTSCLGWSWRRPWFRSLISLWEPIQKWLDYWGQKGVEERVLFGLCFRRFVFRHLWTKKVKASAKYSYVDRNVALHIRTNASNHISIENCFSELLLSYSSNSSAKRP